MSASLQNNRTMSLYESGDSSGTVSLSGMFEGAFGNVRTGEVRLPTLAHLIARGGWPEALEASAEESSLYSRELLESVGGTDFPFASGVRRDGARMTALVRALALRESEMVSARGLIRDVADLGGGTMDPDTLSGYLADLRAAGLAWDQPAFDPGVPLSLRAGRRPKRRLADPSLSAAALGMDADGLIGSLGAMEALFEALCTRDLRIYAEGMGGSVGHYRDGRGNTVDATVLLEDGRWGAFDVRLGMNQVDSAAEKLIGFREKIADDDGRRPEVLCVLVGLSSYAYRREDGVYVVPITALRDR